jgi:hypothetical protein
LFEVYNLLWNKQNHEILFLLKPPNSIRFRPKKKDNKESRFDIPIFIAAYSILKCAKNCRTFPIEVNATYINEHMLMTRPEFLEAEEMGTQCPRR